MQLDRASQDAAFIYVRISRDKEGAGLGVERQREDCEKLAAELGLTVAAIYDDNDTSAYALRKPRKGFDAMNKALEAGEATKVLVWHTDRLVRRTAELESFIELCERHGVTVHTVKAGILDLSTATGQMIARVQGAIAQHEVARGIERMKAAKRQAALDGKYLGGPRPFGWEAGAMELRKNEANAVRDGAVRLLRGVSVRQITREWNEAGLRTSRGGKFSAQQVRAVLLRKRNAGLLEHNGKIVGEGNWEPIFDIDTLTAVEALLLDPERSKNVTFERRWMGSGVYRCGRSRCPGRMTTISANKGSVSTRSYRCEHSAHLARVAEPVDEYVEALVLERLSRADAAITLGSDEEIADIDSLKAREAAIVKRLDDLMVMFNDDEITSSQLKSGTAQKKAELAEVRAEIARAREKSVLANLILTGDDLKTSWDGLSADVKGKVIDALMTVTILPSPRGRKPGGRYFDPACIQIEWKDPAAGVAT
ncbi:recombinase family protein [Nocardia sp. CDC159]|uniref:Recombinase family protein n=1 Tax=Nocardia pulmonis TaxID=2951408 RepID=A0A9X2IZU6_9NOCA|nr:MULTISPECIES: recombinase family protein [Nocardia]MCM6776440.1 recombinase family protein [Nocardia pulmonis]MCM6788864.1 recombinase family protein [Nocardia sp. CDC159]